MPCRRPRAYAHTAQRLLDHDQTKVCESSCPGSLSLSLSPLLYVSLALSLSLSFGRRADGSRSSPTPAVGDRQLIDKGMSVRQVPRAPRPEPPSQTSQKLCGPVRLRGSSFSSSPADQVTSQTTGSWLEPEPEDPAGGGGRPQEEGQARTCRSAGGPPGRFGPHLRS